MTLGRSAWILGIAGFLLLVAAGSVWFVTGSFSVISQVLGLFGMVALGAWIYADRAAIQAGATAREVSVSAAALLVVVLSVALGVLVGGLAQRWDQTWDITRSGRYSLSERTRTVMGALDQDVTIYALFRKGSPGHEKFERLGELLRGASPRVKVEPIDPLMEPARAASVIQATGQAEMDRLAESGTVLIQAGSRRRRIESRFDEESLTNAIVKLTRGDDTRVCWSVGHGERDPDDDQTLTGFGVSALRLEDRNFVITEQRILTAGVDRACKVLVIAGPTQDFTERELEAVAAYVAEGGQVLALLQSPRVEGSSTATLDADLLRYGLELHDDVIIENNPAFVTLDENNEPLMVYGADTWTPHPALQGLTSAVAVRWPRTVLPVAGAEGVQPAALMMASAASWGERTWDPAGEVGPTPDPDEPAGPLAFAAVAEVVDPTALRVVATPTTAPADPTLPAALAVAPSLVPADFQPKAGGRVVVIGDADFAANALTSAVDNGAFLLNLVTWLAGDEAQLGADASEHETIVWTGLQFALVGLVGVVLAPGAAALVGVVLVLRRRFL